jgi:hypothetical protein
VRRPLGTPITTAIYSGHLQRTLIAGQLGGHWQKHKATPVERVFIYLFIIFFLNRVALLV